VSEGSGEDVFVASDLARIVPDAFEVRAQLDKRVAMSVPSFVVDVG